MSQLYDICRVVSRRISHFLSMKANTNVHGNYSLRPFFKKKKKKKKKTVWTGIFCSCFVATVIVSICFIKIVLPIVIIIFV